MKTSPFSRKLRQLKNAKVQLETRMANGETFSSNRIQQLIQKIRLLADELARVFSVKYVKHVLGSVALLIGGLFANSASAQHFLDPVTSPFGTDTLEYFVFPALADLDDDGDIDMLTFGYYGLPQYFENVGTPADAQFAAPINNGLGIQSVYYIGVPTFADIDGDGDTDLFVGEYYGAVKFFENTGDAANPNFAAPIDNPFGISPSNDIYLSTPELADMDGDGDYDLLLGETGYDDYSDINQITYFENVGSAMNPLFGKPNSSPFGVTNVPFLPIPDTADLDMDGDLDLMIGNYYASFIYYENVGDATAPVMAPPVLNTFNLGYTTYLSALAFADMDDDGDQDMMVGELYGTIKYFENAPELSVPWIEKNQNISVYPNPVVNSLSIDFEGTIEQLTVIDALGRQVLLVDSSFSSDLDVSKLETGHYLLQITDSKGNLITTRFNKE